MSDAAPKNTGKLRVDAFRLKKLMLARELTLEDLVEQSLVSKQTAQRLIRGGETRMSTLRDVAAALGVRAMDLVHPSEYETPTLADAAEPASDWEIGEPLAMVRSASNGLSYRVFRMQHRHQPTRYGRGKRYELFELPTDEKEQLRAQLIRHTEVCDRVGRCQQLPVCYATYPETSRWVWWVIDEWIDGNTLAEFLKKGRPTVAQAAGWALELAEGLAAVHAAGVVRRELNPNNVLVRAKDGALVLTDFELAKLAGDQPTVSGDWPDDPYRAPEVETGASGPSADLYSWARVVARLVTGEIPTRGQELAALQSKVSARVANLVAQCALLPPSDRCQSVDEVLPTVRKWAAEARNAG